MDIMEKMMSQYGISRFPRETSYAMAYVPFQQHAENMYSPAQAYEVGTVFEDLCKPFLMGDCEDRR